MTLEEMIKIQKAVKESKKNAEVIFYKLEGQDELLIGLIEEEKKRKKEESKK